MYKHIQHIVNAQVEVNRAVFEANRGEPNEEFIQKCVDQAIKDLTKAKVKLEKKKND